MSQFIDYVRIYGKAGNGGAGSSHFRREKNTNKGGPDGGDGGDGGSLSMIAEKNHSTLLHLHYKRHTRAKNGAKGGAHRRTGAQGESLCLAVPLGTIARRSSGELIGEVLSDQEQLLLLKGGKGGKGNSHFATSTRQTPTYAQNGLIGEEERITLELKLLAEVGLVGFPNAGKSTLLSALSAARPQIAPYAFTTLHPVLGIVKLKGYRTLVMADLPGIIEGASQGKGLGTRFLRHIERNVVLLFVISAEEADISTAWQRLNNELITYEPSLSKKKQLLVISKSDLLDEKRYEELLTTLPRGIYCHKISSHTGEGLEALKELLWAQLER